MAVRPEDNAMDVEQDEIEEAQIVKPKPRPYQPTAADVELHNRTHLPYRSWCEHCVKGRGRNTAHRRLDMEAERERLQDFA